MLGLAQSPPGAIGVGVVVSYLNHTSVVRADSSAVLILYCNTAQNNKLQILMVMIGLKRITWQVWVLPL